MRAPTIYIHSISHITVGYRFLETLMLSRFNRGVGYLDAATNCRTDTFLGRLKLTSSFAPFRIESSSPRVRSNRESAKRAPQVPYEVIAGPSTFYREIETTAGVSLCYKRTWHYKF